MSLAGLLTALAGPLAKRVLTALGLGMVTFAGVEAAVQAGLSAAQSNFSGVGADVAAILAMGGVFTALSIVAGGITAGLSMMILSRIAAV